MSLLPNVGGSAEVLGRVTRGRRVAHGTRRRGRRSSAAARTTRAARRASASIAPGEVVTSWGTSGTVLAPTARAARRSAACARTRSVTSLPDVWYLMGVVLSAGGAFAWYRDQLARELAGVTDAAARARRRGGVGSARRGGRDVPSVPAGRAHAASRRVGARRVPRTQPRAHARASRRARCSRASASRCAIRVTILQELGLVAESPAAHRRRREERVRSGGCRREIFGLPVTTVNREEGPAYGAALLAAVGAGAFPDLARRGERDAHARAARASRSAARTRSTRSRMRASATSFPAARPDLPDAWLTPSTRTSSSSLAHARSCDGCSARRRRGSSSWSRSSPSR